MFRKDYQALVSGVLYSLCTFILLPTKLIGLDTQLKLQKQTLTYLKEKFERLTHESTMGRVLQPIELILPLATCLEIIRTYPISDKQKEKVLTKLELIHQQATRYEEADQKPTYKHWRVVADSTYSLEELSQLASHTLQKFLNKT